MCSSDLFLRRLSPPTQTRQTPAAPPQARRAVGAIDGRVELADRVGIGPGIGETEAALLALDRGKPKARSAGRGIRSFDEGRPRTRTAEQAVGFLPDNDWLYWRDWSSRVTRKKTHPWKSFSPSDRGPHAYWDDYSGPAASGQSQEQ